MTTMNSRDALTNLSEQARTLLSHEAELERMEQQNLIDEQRARALEEEAAKLLKDLIRTGTKEHRRFQEIGDEIKEVKAQPAFQNAERSFKEVKESSGLDDLTLEKKEIKQEITADAAKNQEIQYLKEQAEELRAGLSERSESIGDLRERNRAASRHVIEQAAQIVQLPLL